MLEEWAVKKFQSGVVKDPITITGGATAQELGALMQEHNIFGVPVVESGELLDIVTCRGVCYEKDFAVTVATEMKQKKYLVTVQEGEYLDEVKCLSRKYCIKTF